MEGAALLLLFLLLRRTEERVGVQMAVGRRLTALRAAVVALWRDMLIDVVYFCRLDEREKAKDRKIGMMWVKLLDTFPRNGGSRA